MTPFISIIIPTYNRSKIVRQTIESVLAQTYDNFELLILDDHSTDDSQLIIAQISDPRIKYIRHQCNLGFVSNWTYGVRLASGDYLAILGDDDLYKPDFLLNRIKAFQANPDLLAVTGQFECCDINNNVIRKSRAHFESNKVIEGDDLVDFTLGFTGEWFNGATVYRSSVYKSLWQEVTFAGTALDLAMHIHLALFPAAKILNLSTFDMLLRVHPGQESQSNNIRLAENCAIMIIKLWHFRINPEIIYIKKFRKGFSREINHYGRVLWDQGRIREARSIFFNELVISPLNWMTWARLIRTYLVKIR